MKPQTPWEHYQSTLDTWLRLRLSNRIRLCAGLWLGWRQAKEGESAKVPFATPTYPGSLVVPGHGLTNCVKFTSANLYGCFPTAYWTASRLKMLMLDDARPDAPILACIEAGIGQRVSSIPQGRWMLAQGWSKAGTGHQWLERHSGGLVECYDSGGTIGPRHRYVTQDYLEEQFDDTIHRAVLDNRRR